METVGEIVEAWNIFLIFMNSARSTDFSVSNYIIQESNLSG
jgi:hypothetical protein